MHVTILGLGYVGLPTAAIITGKGIRVLGVDLNKSVVDIINKGKIHFVEPELDGLVHHAVQNKLLTATTKVKEASDVFIIAVPTPLKKQKLPDTSYVETATRMVIPFLKPGNLFIIESTSPVGTTEKMAKIIFDERPGLRDKIRISYCPERVLPGAVIYELQQNDRVIGGIDEASTEAALKFYAHFVKGKLHGTDSRTAEMCKLAENAYRDVNIAFANELSMICDKAGINVSELIDLASRHPRVRILNPGPGVGGHCVAVDPWFIISDFPNEAKIVRLARQVNTGKKEWVLKKIREAAKKFQKSMSRPLVIACMGLAYKADIDDLRHSPALEIFQALESEKFHVIGVEPNLNRHDEIKLTEASAAIRKADLIVFLVAHKEFRTLSITGKKNILDFCGITDKVEK